MSAPGVCTYYSTVLTNVKRTFERKVACQTHFMLLNYVLKMESDLAFSTKHFSTEMLHIHNTPSFNCHTSTGRLLFMFNVKILHITINIDKFGLFIHYILSNTTTAVYTRSTLSLLLHWLGFSAFTQFVLFFPWFFQIINTFQKLFTCKTSFVLFFIHISNFINKIFLQKLRNLIKNIKLWWKISK